MRRLARVPLIALLMLSLSTAVIGTGCATKTTTVTERTNEQGEKEVVTTTTEEPERPQGILSSAVGVVGDILALPFRAVAWVVQLVF